MPEVSKKPQDRLPKKDALRSITVKGVDLVVDPKMFDDFEVVDSLFQLQNGNGLHAAGLLRKFAGEKFIDVMDALRDGENGRVPVDAAVGFLEELMDAVNPN